MRLLALEGGVIIHDENMEWKYTDDDSGTRHHDS
jgi:hypothetical protein